ncbi:uncharacterized protein DNG_03903 [Cephalotrichum gorgonifer]|uniref:DUF1993 domain-containing protein n=1 Tax=Cephalotrichum gorgonifer TaxID=2041049 RepID=A0AAE8SU23_9PEZI|nr:uncharacterized protein DNG_03903 [Cephalotrichum gorgonifer]
MGYSFYEGTVPHFKGALASLNSILKKAEEYAAEKSIATEDILSWRLADDMLPFSFQAYMVIDTTRKLLARVNGEEPVALDKDSFNSFAAIYNYIAETEKALATADPAVFEARSDVTVTIGMGQGNSIEAPAKGWAALYGLPNVFFHLTTAYAILRNKGVPLGKRDYVGAFVAPWISA